MHTGVTQNTDDKAVSLAGVAALSSPARRAGQTEIIQFPFQAAQCRRPLQGLDATELDDCFESLGSVAVRLVAAWKLPRISVVMTATGGEAP